MSKINRFAYEKLIAEDLAWLEKQPRTLERDHIRAIVRDSVGYYYPPEGRPCPTCCGPEVRPSQTPEVHPLTVVRAKVEERLRKTKARNGRIVGCSWQGTIRALEWMLSLFEDAAPNQTRPAGEMAVTDGEELPGFAGPVDVPPMLTPKEVKRADQIKRLAETVDSLQAQTRTYDFKGANPVPWRGLLEQLEVAEKALASAPRSE